MSDGPHRSLPLRPAWKTTAKWAARDAHPVAEVSDMMGRAARDDLRDVPLSMLQRIFDIDGTPSLFGADAGAVLDALECVRADCRGSVAAEAVIDGAMYAIQCGLAGEDALREGVEFGLDRVFWNNARAIEEHYQRQAGDRSARQMRERLGEAIRNCDIARIAKDFVGSCGAAPKQHRPERHSGLDDGPAMPL